MTSGRYIIVDDHPLFRGALRQAIASAFKGVMIDEAGSLSELEMRLDDKSGAEVDLVLLDLAMPGVQGLSGLLLLRQKHPDVPVIVVSATDDPATIRRCIEFGASGYVPKSQPVEKIRDAVRAVMSGDVWVPDDVSVGGSESEGDRALAGRLSSLTQQQMRVLLMLGEGLLNKQIAYKLSVSEATVKAHVSAILQKLGVDSRTQAVIVVNKIGMGNWSNSVE
jgi:DNA-binding NarL/FixJ family response regulator